MLTLLCVVVFLFLVIAGPIFTIGALNVLFSTHLPVNLQTYFAVLWLATILTGGIQLRLNKG